MEGEKSSYATYRLKEQEDTNLTKIKGGHLQHGDLTKLHRYHAIEMEDTRQAIDNWADLKSSLSLPSMNKISITSDINYYIDNSCKTII